MNGQAILMNQSFLIFGNAWQTTRSMNAIETFCYVLGINDIRFHYQDG
jgi:hypothetical protein